MQNKEQVRQKLNDKRAAIGDVERNVSAQSAMQLLVQHPLFAESVNIACYLSRREEFDTTPIIQAIWKEDKKCLLPILSSEQENFLQFVVYQKNDELQLNKYRILEPKNGVVFAPEKLDLVLLPLVGFDLKGHRLGAGGGYYDRTFSFLKNKDVKKPVLLGLAFEIQSLYEVPHDEWDVGLDGIVTEKRILMFK